jgi:branched-chain amino acid transport system permease protein
VVQQMQQQMLLSSFGGAAGADRVPPLAGGSSLGEVWARCRRSAAANLTCCCAAEAYKPAARAQEPGQRSAEAEYIGASLRLGETRIPYRLLVAAGVALLLTVVLTTFFSRTFVGRAIKAVGQDEGALRLMGADPVKIKQLAFGIATSVNALAGAMLIIVSPVDPTMDRIYIGRTFCVVVLAGMGSMSGTLVAGLVLGVAESIVLTMFGASWATAVAFGLLLLMLGIRPQGLFGR